MDENNRVVDYYDIDEDVNGAFTFKAHYLTCTPKEGIEFLNNTFNKSK
jgi:hypothetical protein